MSGITLTYTTLIPIELNHLESVLVFKSFVLPDNISLPIIIIPENISFAKAYPNPFNARTRVDYVLNSGIGEIATSVKVFNVQGKLIEEILLNKSSPGLNTFFWEPKNITSGVYIFELLTGNQKNILKVLLLK